MNHFFLSNTSLFHGIREQEIGAMLGCLGSREGHYDKGEIIFRAGEAVTEIGLGSGGPRTHLCEIRMRLRDWAVVALAAALIAYMFARHSLLSGALSS